MDRHIVTANRLSDGQVVFLAATGWSPLLAEAHRLPRADAEAALPAPTATQPVVGAHVVELDEDGLPALIRERIRILGPTVRPDLAKPLEA